MHAQKPADDEAELKDLTVLQVLMGEPSDESATYTKTSSLQVSDALLVEPADSTCTHSAAGTPDVVKGIPADTA